jgi:hypothetical protein
MYRRFNVYALIFLNKMFLSWVLFVTVLLLSTGTVEVYSELKFYDICIAFAACVILCKIAA